jgi:hypothetical protein
MYAKPLGVLLVAFVLVFVLFVSVFVSVFVLVFELKDAFNNASSANVIKMVVPPKPLRCNICERANSADSFGVFNFLLNILYALRRLRQVAKISALDVYVCLEFIDVIYIKIEIKFI